MKDIACSAEEALSIAGTIGFPCFVIPWGLGNIPYSSFICYTHKEVVALWDLYMAEVKTPAFNKAHVLKAYGWLKDQPPTKSQILLSPE